MARAGGNPNLRGGPGSGRKSAGYERLKREAIRKAWTKVEKEVAKAKTEAIALPLALKDMTTKVEGDVNVSFSLSKLFDESKNYGKEGSGDLQQISK
jgi:hypothetical protein